MDSEANEKSLVLDIYFCCNIIWSSNIYRFRFVYLILVVLLPGLVYSIDNYGTYYLVGQQWTTERGDRVLKCLYRYDMSNKLVTIEYKYPCPTKIVDKINK